jgi:hypothetical protein
VIIEQDFILGYKYNLWKREDSISRALSGSSMGSIYSVD